jgi:hypothetical protein
MISVADFMTWIVSLRTSSGERPGYSTYNSHRSAFFNLFRNYGETMDAHLSSELTHHFKGLKRLTIRNIGEGMARIKIGKDPLSFGLYKFLGKAFLTQHSREYIFAHHFMIMCWNLMCRSANAFQIKHSHMEWSEDSLCVYFAHMKNDQTG